MNVPLALRALWRTLGAIEASAMSKSGEAVFYAVGRGKQVGIYDTWKECKAQTEGVANAKYRKFYSYQDAEEFVNFWKNYSTPVKDSVLSENLVSRITDCDGSATNGGPWTRRGAPFESGHPRKRKAGNRVLGCDALEEVQEREGPMPVRPYTSPLSTDVNPNYASFLSRKAKAPSRTPNGSSPAGLAPTGRRRGKFKPKSKGDFGKSSSSTPPSPSGLSGGPEVLHISRPFVAPVESAVPSNGSAGEGKQSEAWSGLPCEDHPEDILCVGKKEVAEMSHVDSGGESDGFHGNGQAAEVSDKLTLCLSLLGSVLSRITQQNANATEKTRNFLEALLGERITDVDTNADVNPQMEPQGNVDVTCEDTKNFDKVQPVGIAAPEAQGPPPSGPQSSPPSSAALQPSPSRFCFAEGRLDQKNADVLALNLRLDSFERRFDACLKEIGAIAAEISHIKSDIKELKECLSSSPKRGAASSPSKARDGRVQTTLCFDLDGPKKGSGRGPSGQGSGADSGAKEGRGLKRRLSGSDSSEKAKRFADDDIDDLLSRIKTEKVDYTSFTLDEDDYVEVYTDGSALSNGKGDAKAGIGIWFGDNHPLNVAEPVVGPPTNNTAEIQAARVAIQLATKAGITKLKIHTDSEFLINCATKWIPRWKTNGWTLRDGGPVKNKKELEKLDKAASKISVRWEKVPAHSNIKGNETADRLANEGAARYER